MRERKGKMSEYKPNDDRYRHKKPKHLTIRPERIDKAMSERDTRNLLLVTRNSLIHAANPRNKGPKDNHGGHHGHNTRGNRKYE